MKNLLLTCGIFVLPLRADYAAIPMPCAEFVAVARESSCAENMFDNAMGSKDGSIDPKIEKPTKTIPQPIRNYETKEPMELKSDIELRIKTNKILELQEKTERLFGKIRDSLSVFSSVNEIKDKTLRRIMRKLNDQITSAEATYSALTKMWSKMVKIRIKLYFDEQDIYRSSGESNTPKSTQTTMKEDPSRSSEDIHKSSGESSTLKSAQATTKEDLSRSSGGFDEKKLFSTTKDTFSQFSELYKEYSKIRTKLNDIKKDFDREEELLEIMSPNSLSEPDRNYRESSIEHIKSTKAAFEMAWASIDLYATASALKEVVTSEPANHVTLSDLALIIDTLEWEEDVETIDKNISNLITIVDAANKKKETKIINKDISNIVSITKKNVSELNENKDLAKEIKTLINEIGLSS